MWPTIMTGLTWESPLVTSELSVTSVHHIEAYQSGWHSIESQKVWKIESFNQNYLSLKNLTEQISKLSEKLKVET
jgi:hypothetical protein